MSFCVQILILSHNNLTAFDMGNVNSTIFAGLSANSERAILSSGCSVHESTKLASSGSKPKDIRNLELPKSPISSSHVKLSHNRENPSEDL